MVQLSTILLKITGLSFIAFAIIDIAGYAPFLIRGERYTSTDVISIFLSYAFFPLLFSYILISHTKSVKKWLKLPTNPTLSKSNELETVALSILGMFLVFHSISDLAYYLGELWKVRELQAAGMIFDETEVTLLTPEKHGLIVATLVELGFSLYLTVGSKGIVNVLNRLRR